MLTILPERRILILLAGMIGGIALVRGGYGGRDLRLAGVLEAAPVWLGIVIRMRRAGLVAWVEMAPIEQAASRVDHGPNQGPNEGHQRHLRPDRLMSHGLNCRTVLQPSSAVRSMRCFSGPCWCICWRSWGRIWGCCAFGVIQLVRFAGAMFPGWAVGVAQHKYALLVGLME